MLAVVSDPIDAVRVDEVTAGAARHPVALAICGIENVAAGPAEQPVRAAAAGENIVAGEAVQDVRAAKPAEHVSTGRAAEDVAAGRTCPCRRPYCSSRGSHRR